jgi:hypothetical protein
MSVIIEFSNYLYYKQGCNRKSYCWYYDIHKLNWSLIFNYISDQFRIPISQFSIHNNTKIYKYNNIEHSPLFQSIKNNFRYINIKSGDFTDTILFTVNI